MELLCLDFVNSEFRDFRGRWSRDDLQNPEWLTQFLKRWNLCIAALPDAAVLEQLVVLRTLLTSVVRALTCHETIAQEDLDALNERLRLALFNYQLIPVAQGYQLASAPIAQDWNWVQSEIIADFALLLTEHDPLRLKICENAHCRWIFYDETKSRTRRYCTTDKCANLVKLRRFRARHTKVAE